MQQIHIYNFKYRSINNVFNKVPKKYFKKALIIGAGNCLQAEMLEPYCENIVCTEINDSIKFIKSTETCKYLQVDAENLRETFTNEKFDLIFSSSVLEHIPNIEKTMDDINFLLTDDGISVHYLPNLLWKFLHIFLYLPDKIICIIDKKIFNLRKIKALFTEDDNFNNVKLNKEVKFTLKNLIVPLSPHGVSCNHIEEFYNFSHFYWIKIFKKGKFKIILSRGTTFSSGYLYGYGVLQEILEFLNIFTESVYILKKNCKEARGENYMKKPVKCFPSISKFIKNIF